MRFATVLISILIAFSVSACSKSEGITPDIPDQISSADLSDLDLSRTLLGIFTVTVNPGSGTASLEPAISRNANLGEQYLGDITAFLTSVFCQDCAKIDSISLTEDGYVDLAITLRHPFELPLPSHPPSRKRIDLHLFDVFGEIFTDNGIGFEQPLIHVNAGLLVNADGYSGIFDPVIDNLLPTQNDYHPYKIFAENSTQGNFNPFSFEYGFSDPFFPSGHNVFPQGSGDKTAHYILNLPPDQSTEFILVFSAAYGVSAKFNVPEGEYGSRLMPRYFLPRFNRYEAWKIKVDIPSYLNFLTSGNPEQGAQVLVDVWDWQDGISKSTSWDFFESRCGEISFTSNLDRIEIYASELLDEPMVIDADDADGMNPRSFTINLRNEKHAPIGTYWGIVCAIDEMETGLNLIGFKRDGSTPFLYNKIRTYQLFQIDVKSNSSAVPNNPVDITPPELNGYFTDVLVNNTLVYACAGVLGVSIFDISNSAYPVLISSVDTEGSARRATLSDDNSRLYVADSKSGLVIINVENASNPFVEGTYSDSGLSDIRHVQLHGNYAYLGDSESGLAVINISNPENPQLVGYYTNLPQVRALEIQNNYLYKLDSQTGLEVISLANPENPQSLNVVAIDGTKRDFDIENNIGVVLLKNRLITANMNNPELPVLKGTLDLDPTAQDVDLVNGLMYIANGTTGIQVVASEDLSDPFIVSVFNTPGYAWALSVRDSSIFAADGDGGMVVLTSVGGDLGSRGNYNTIGRAIGTSIFTEHCYVSTGYSGLKSVDISTQESSHISSVIDSRDYAYDCDTSGTALYVADSYEGIAVYSIENPSEPAYMGNVQITNWDNWLTTSVKTSGNAVIIYGPQIHPEYPDILCLDSSNPYSPSFASELSLPDTAFDVALDSNYMYIAAGVDGILPVDISQLYNPISGDYYFNSKACLTLTKSDQYLHAMFNDLGLESFDMSDPMDPVLISGASSLGQATEICVSGDYMYVNIGGNKLIIFDVSSPYNPQYLTYMNLQDEIREIVVRGNFAYIANWDAGLRIIKLW